MTDTQELIARLEAATADDAGLMRQAFAALYPEPALDCEPAWRPENPKQPIYHAWKTRQIRFEQLLRAEAYESAALTLVPVGWSYDLRTFHTASGAGMVLHPPSASEPTICARAPTPALAIVIAALRAGEG